MGKTDLSKFNNSWYKPGSAIKRLTWYFINLAIFKNGFILSSSLKRFLLRLYGAKIGKGVVIKPNVNIKYPWKLAVGNNVWVGENVWIDNLEQVNIGDNVCISQGALILSGNHNYKKATFDLMLAPITIEDGVWIGANSVVCQGAVCKSHSILTVGSVTSSILEPYGIYQGIPAVKIRERVIE